jgi:hypothetical protein
MRHSPDTFLVHQFHLNRRAVLTALDRQAVSIGEDRSTLIGRLKDSTPEFYSLLKG